MESKKVNFKYIHIGIIIVGIIFISLSIFHTSLWFDESYSVGMASKSFLDIYLIGGNDVHPILYYYILHIFYLIFGTNIYVYRLLSMIPLAILSIIGYTHIRKDFGEKVGFLFSFFTLFLPLNCVYSGEIRMYTWAMLLVSLMAIYAYRIYIKSSYKNWILFSIFSVLSAYTHYYSLATAFIINLILCIYFIRKAINERKQDSTAKMYTTELKCFTVSAISQILIYSPWIICVWKQVLGLSNGFWISRPTLKLFLEIFIFQFTGNLNVKYINQTIAILYGLSILAYTIYCIVRMHFKNEKIEERKANNAGAWAIGIYFMVTLFILIISIKKPILYPRYFLTLTGLFIFFVSFYIANMGKKLFTVIISILTIIISITINYKMIQINYAKSNNAPIEYVKEDLKQDDMIIFENESGSGFVLSMHFDNIQNCFYDAENWNVEPAYRAFGKNLLYINNLDELNDYKGRIWIVDTDNYNLYNKILEKYGEDEITLLKQNEFNTEYHSYRYEISLINKQ